jgi:hypothetical protein
VASSQSNEELFQAVRDLVGRLEASGRAAAAAELAEGFRCINGLTDGWASFLESIDTVRAAHATGLVATDLETLEQLRDAAYEAVHRQ